MSVHETDSSRPGALHLAARVGAAVLDLLLLGLVKLGLSFAGDPTVDRIAQSPLSATVLLAAYIGVATAWRGRTVGQAILRLRTVESPDRPVGWRAAWSRALLLAFLLSPPYEMGLRPTTLDVLLSSLQAGLVVATLLCVALDRPARRTLHDLLSGTVILAEGRAAPAPAALSRDRALALAGAGALAAALNGALWVGVRRPADPARMETVAALRARLAEVPEVVGVEVAWRYNCGAERSRGLVVAYEERSEDSRATVAPLCGELPILESPRLTVRGPAGADGDALLEATREAIRASAPEEPLERWEIVLELGGVRYLAVEPSLDRAG